MPDTPIQTIGDKWARTISDSFESWAEDVKLNGRSNTPIVRFDPAPLIEAAMLEAGEAQLGELGKLLGTGLKFDLKSPDAIKWAKEYAANQVKYIDAGTRAGIKQVTLRGLQDGLSPREQSKAIRSMVGLLPQHIIAVQNRRESLLSTGMDASSVEKLTAKYASQLLKYRADTIGLTESHTSTNEGARQVNSDAIYRGIIAKDEYLQEWLSAADKARCSKCGGMQGKTAKIGGDFAGDGRGPPLHPRCRCTVILVKNPDYKGKEPQAYVPFKTLSECETYAKQNFGIKEFGYDVPAKYGEEYDTIEEKLEKFNRINGELARMRTTNPNLKCDVDVLCIAKHDTGVATLGHGKEKWLATKGYKNNDISWYTKTQKDTEILKGHRITIERYENARFIEDNLRHELGHTLSTYEIRSEYLDIVTALPRSKFNVKTLISEYATKSEYEAIAESFAWYTAPDYKGGLPKALEAMCERMLGNAAKAEKMLKG